MAIVKDQVRINSTRREDGSELEQKAYWGDTFVPTGNGGKSIQSQDYLAKG